MQQLMTSEKSGFITNDRSNKSFFSPHGLRLVAFQWLIVPERFHLLWLHAAWCGFFMGMTQKKACSLFWMKSWTLAIAISHDVALLLFVKNTNTLEWQCDQVACQSRQWRDWTKMVQNNYKIHDKRNRDMHQITKTATAETQLQSFAQTWVNPSPNHDKR